MTGAGRAPDPPLFAELVATLERTWVPQPDKPEETPELTIRALWCAAAGAPCSVIAAADRSLPPLDERGVQRVRAVVRQRASGVPLAHLTGRQRFLDLELLAGPEALIPRRETELLARAGIDLATEAAAARRSATVIDLCTGAGNIALAIAAHVPAARVYAADLSAEAVALARRNAEHLALAERVTFEAGDLFAPFDRSPYLGTTDVVTCNPPYISSSKVASMSAEIAQHEPRLAFDGGAFGVDLLFRVVSNAPRFLRPGGALAMEVGLGQGRSIAQRLASNAAYRDVRPLEDAHGAIRVVTARRVD